MSATGPAGPGTGALLRPAAIQPHGVLLAVTEPGLRVVAVSANLGEWFGAPPAAAVGAELGDVIGVTNRVVVDRARIGDWVQRCDDVPLLVGHRSSVATLHRTGGLLVIEVEDVDGADPYAAPVVREAAMALQHAASVGDVAADAARWIRSLTRFDRVMVHRFDADGNGEVIAEERRPDLDAVLGLRYPAAVISAPARELFRRNWLQLIPDTGYVPVPLVPPQIAASSEPVDLAMATLRSVSPVHVGFLEDMGVSAALSLSIVIRGELWGLIACYQHGGSHRPDVGVRNAAEFLAQLTSLRIAETAEAELRARTADLVAVADHVAERLQSPTVPDLHDVLQAREVDVLDLARATGAVVVTAAGWIRLGVVPSDDVVARLIEQWPPESTMVRTDRIGVEDAADTASGVLAFALANDRRDVVLWFRREHVRVIDWVGTPPPGGEAQPVGASAHDDASRRPPSAIRHWREVVRGRSDPWQESEIRAAMRFTRHLTTALMRRERHHAEIASDLQRAMRPASVPTVEGWGIHVHDEPAGTGLIGGDWFDVFDAGGGLLVAVVGDVAGHGLRAAAEMAQLRNSLRAYLLDDPSPSGALERLDAMMARVLPGTIATAVCAVIDTATATTRMSHAGHVPAIVGSLAGAAFVGGAEGDALLGVGHGHRREQQLVLAPGAALVMYSDGLIEQRQRSIDDGLEVLRLTIPKGLAQPDGTNLAAWVAEQVHDDRHVDDTSVLVLRRLD